MTRLSVFLIVAGAIFAFCGFFLSLPALAALTVGIYLLVRFMLPPVNGFFGFFDVLRKAINFAMICYFSMMWTIALAVRWNSIAVILHGLPSVLKEFFLR